MANEKNVVKVGNYKEYDMLCSLIEDNLSSGNTSDVIIDDGIIKSGSTSYIKASLRDQTSDVETNSDGLFKRFDSFYKSTTSVDSWETLKENVVNRFFSRRNYLIYSPLFVTRSAEEHKSKIMKYLDAFLAKDVNRDLLDVRPLDEADEKAIYEVSVKFAMKFNGEPVYVVNKFYFDEKNTLLSSSLSNRMYANVNDYGKSKKDSSDASEQCEIHSEQVQKFYNQIIGIMREDCKDYLVGKAKETFLEYSSKLDGDKIEIECGAPRFRYVARLKVYLKRFIVVNKITNDKLLEASIDGSDRISFSCLQCGEDDLCTTNSIKVFHTVTDGNVISFNRTFDINNLNREDYQPNALSVHVSNPLPECHGCYRLICRNKVSECDVCGHDVCTNCNSLSHTIKLPFSTNVVHRSCTLFCDATLHFVAKTDVKTCKCCAKVYSNEYFPGDGNYCELCAPLFKEEVPEIYHQIFDEHKDLFPVFARKRENVANEDMNGIIFRVGYKYYYLDKNDLDLKSIKMKFLGTGVSKS